MGCRHAFQSIPDMIRHYETVSLDEEFDEAQTRLKSSPSQAGLQAIIQQTPLSLQTSASTPHAYIEARTKKLLLMLALGDQGRRNAQPRPTPTLAFAPTHGEPNQARANQAPLPDTANGARPDNHTILHRAPFFVKMAQNLDLRCVLVPAPWVLGPKHVSIRPRL